jgi:hypothetical protein
MTPSPLSKVGPSVPAATLSDPAQSCSQSPELLLQLKTAPLNDRFKESPSLLEPEYSIMSRCPDCIGWHAPPSASCVINFVARRSPANAVCGGVPEVIIPQFQRFAGTPAVSFERHLWLVA